MDYDSNLQTLNNEIQAMSSDHLSEIGKIWQEIGFLDDSDQYQRKYKEIDYNKQILSQVLGEWLSDTKKEQNDMIHTLKKSENSIRDYCEKLKLEENDYFVKNGTLLHRSFAQNENSESLHKLISDRTERYRLCQESERVILQRLRFSTRMDQKFVPEEANEAVPSEKTIEDFTEHVSSLSEREKKREDILINIRTKCVEILIEIEEVSSNMSKFAQSFLFSTELEDLSDEFMENAKKSMEKIQILREEREEKIKDMANKISAIVQRLEIEDEEIVPDRTDLSNKNTEECREQLARLEELKRASMDIMIEKTEEEIMNIEYEIYASELEKLKFERQVLGKIGNKEDKLTALENRLEGLKNRYEENIELFESVRIWKECFEELKDLEEKEKDPSRLNNRGGALMKQQKAKRKLLNKMPKLERKIHETATNLGRKCPNLNGYSSVEEFLLTLQEDHEAEKYAEREAKKIEKNHQLMQESKFGVNTSSVKKRGANRVIQNSAKRTKPENPNLQSSVASSTKTRSTASSTRSNNSLKPPVSSARARTPSKQKQTPQSTPVSRFTPGKQMSSSRVALPGSSKKISHKSGFGFKAPNMKPSSAQREKENVSPSDRVGSARVGRVTEKPKRTAKDRRSKTPDRLTRSKPAGRIFNKLPSSGMRRRSKSVSNLNTITENRFGTNKLSTIVDDSLVSLTSDQFNRDLMSQGRPDSSPFSSSFIDSKRSQHQYAQTP